MSNAIRAAEPGPRASWAGGSIAVAAGILGFALGAALAGVFWVLRASWEQLPGMSHEATTTVPYWTVQFLGPILVSVCWTSLLLHARRVSHWQAWSAAALGLELVLLVIGLLPIALAGNGGVGVTNIAQPLLLLTMLAMPVAAAFRPRGRGAAGVGWHVLAAGLFPVALWFGQSIWAPQTLLI